MRSKDPLIPQLLLAALSAVAFSSFAVHSPTAKTATDDYAMPQVAPPSASNLGMADIAAILNEQVATPYLVAYRLTTTDDNGRTAGLAPLKVVPTNDRGHAYLGVFHNQINTTQFATYLGYSSNLSAWHTIGQIHSPASQPDIRILPDDSVFYAEEYNPSGRPHVRIQYYGNASFTGLQALITNPAFPPTKAVTLPGTALAKADGTPEFGRISYSGDITGSTAEITHHYYNLGERDLQADGTLIDFKDWSSAADTVIDDLVTNAGGTGKIGDREIFRAGSQVYEVVEAQVHPASANDYGSWRLFLINRTTSAIQQLSPELTGGAKSLGNPTVSFVTLPNGAPALVFTCFVFDANNGSTPPGGHIFVYPLP